MMDLYSEVRSSDLNNEPLVILHLQPSQSPSELLGDEREGEGKCPSED